MNELEAHEAGFREGYSAATYVDVGIGDTDLETWFERDRAYVALQDREGNTIVEWWDADVEEAIQDGILRMHLPLGSNRAERVLHQSAFEYAEETGLFPTREVLIAAAYEGVQTPDGDLAYNPGLTEVINESPNSEELRAAYEQGVADGIEAGVRKRRPEEPAGIKLKKAVRRVTR